MGLRCTGFRPGWGTFVLAASPWPANPNGAVHGGLVAACADQCMGVVAVSVLDECRRPATATMNVEYQRPAMPPLSFEARVGRVGRTLQFVSVDVRDGRGRLAARVSGAMVTDGSSRHLDLG
jgi:uncharacterized protein (TIGR00369 family)